MITLRDESAYGHQCFLVLGPRSNSDLVFFKTPIPPIVPPFPTFR
jgi:hypothetical protein